MAVRSKRLFGPLTVTTANTLAYTCPAGRTALLKWLSAANVAALGATLISGYINGTLGGQLVLQQAVPNGLDLQLPLWIVLHPGDIFRLKAGQASLIVSGFGAELEGVAD